GAVAEMRGAPVIGEILGFGCTSESGGLLPVRSDGDGLSRAIRIALETAGLQPSEIGMVVAHANGTPNSDDSEAIALDSVFSSSPPPVTGFKWAVGHTIAAAGLIESVLALQSLVNGEVPGLSTLEEPASAAAHLRLSRGPQLPRSKVALVLSRGFGSINTALILRAGATP